MAELASSRLMQVESEGQQNSFGSSVLLQRVYEEGHTSELLGRRPKESKACPAWKLANKVKNSRAVCRSLVLINSLAIPAAQSGNR